MSRKFYTTKSTKRKLAFLQSKREKAYKAISDLAFANNFAHLPFSECKKLVPVGLVEALTAANETLAQAEIDAIHNGQAWRGSLNLLHFYS